MYSWLLRGLWATMGRGPGEIVTLSSGRVCICIAMFLYSSPDPGFAGPVMVAGTLSSLGVARQTTADPRPSGRWGGRRPRQGV